MVSSLLIILFLFTGPILCSPFRLYNQRQDGELNVHAQLDNFIIVLVPTSGINWVDITAKAKPYNQPGSSNVLQIFNKTPSAPYKVDIDKSDAPLDKVSDEAVENETIDPQITDDDNTQQTLRFNIVNGGGNIYNNEVTKQNSSPDDEGGSKYSDKTGEKSSPPQESEKVQENGNVNQKTEDGSKDSTAGNKLAFSSTVTAHLLTPERKIPAVQQTPPHPPPVQEQKNVIIGKAIKNARYMSNSDDNKVVKILQSGLKVCSPGQRLTPRGECVEIPAHTESRLAKLLALRFGLSPASS